MSARGKKLYPLNLDLKIPAVEKQSEPYPAEISAYTVRGILLFNYCFQSNSISKFYGKRNFWLFTISRELF
jgi:hypothetical protein